MSLFAKYLKEKTNDLIVETDDYFLTYRYVDEKTVYIVDLFVLPQLRESGIASTIADNIVEEARKKGCTKLLGSVVPSNKNATTSLKVLLAYGMTLDSSSQDFILFKKDL